MKESLVARMELSYYQMCFRPSTQGRATRRSAPTSKYLGGIVAYGRRPAMCYLEHPMSREPKITPITRHDPRTFYATRATRTRNAEAWDLWAVEDGRRVGYLSAIDDGHMIYALATVKRGTSHDEIADLVDGFFPPSATDALSRETVIADYDEEPVILESEVSTEE